MKSKLLLSAMTTISLIIPTALHGQYQPGDQVWSPPGIGATIWSVSPGATNLARALPLPFFPFDDFSNAPVLYYLGDNQYFFEFDWSTYEDLTSRNDDSGTGPLTAQWDFDTNGIWIEIKGVTNGLAYLSIHNVPQYDYAQLEISPVAAPATWAHGEIVQNTTGTNDLYFAPVPATNRPQMFYRGVLGYPIVSVVANPGAAVEATYTGGLNVSNYFEVTTSGAVSTNLTVFYQLAGSAANGTDYVTLTGRVTIPAGSTNAEIWVQPIFDGVIDGDESVIVRLVGPTNHYLVDLTNWAAIMMIHEDYSSGGGGGGGGPNPAYQAVAYIDDCIGAAYHPLQQAVIISSGDFSITNFFRC